MTQAREAIASALDWLRDGQTPAGEILLIPQDLRTVDPSLAREIASGTLGLCGVVAEIGTGSPFAVRPPTAAWQTALHGFAWLSDLRAAQSEEASALARRLVGDWIDRHGMPDGPAWEPPVAARRLISWLSNAAILIDGASPAEYDRLIVSAARHLSYLVDLAPATSDGVPRLIVRMATVLGAMCMTEQEGVLHSQMPLLLAELDRQVLADGGHVSRHPGVAVELLLDLLPLKQCFVARDLPPPPRLLDCIGRMIRMLRYMRLGDGRLARFNGMGATMVDQLAAVLAFDEGQIAGELGRAEASRYLRLRRRQSLLIMDVGKPPPLAFSDLAHAGALSLEMSSGIHPLIINCGAPGMTDEDWRIQARGTAAHSTLLLGETASGRLVRDAALLEGAAGPGLTGPGSVEAKLAEPDDGAAEVQALHNGYLDRFGAMHARVLRMSAQGDRLDGIDRVFRPGGSGTPAWRDRPYSIHFHTHPTAQVTRGSVPNSADIRLPSGEIWHLTANGTRLGLEESIFFGTASGPQQAVQVVLRGTAFEDTQVRWRLERTKPADARQR